MRTRFTLISTLFILATVPAAASDVLADVEVALASMTPGEIRLIAGHYALQKIGADGMRLLNLDAAFANAANVPSPPPKCEAPTCGMPGGPFCQPMYNVNPVYKR